MPDHLQYNLFYCPVMYTNSKQMPVCRKREKEMLRVSTKLEVRSTIDAPKYRDEAQNVNRDTICYLRFNLLRRGCFLTPNS